MAYADMRISSLTMHGLASVMFYYASELKVHVAYTYLVWQWNIHKERYGHSILSISQRALLTSYSATLHMSIWLFVLFQ